jgi:hypothetical protein
MGVGVDPSVHSPSITVLATKLDATWTPAVVHFSARKSWIRFQLAKPEDAALM